MYILWKKEKRIKMAYCSVRISRNTSHIRKVYVYIFKDNVIFVHIESLKRQFAFLKSV